MYLHFGKHSDQIFCLLSSVLEDGDSSWLWETRPWAETDLPLRQDAVQRRTAHCWVCNCHTGKCMCVCVWVFQCWHQEGVLHPYSFSALSCYMRCLLSLTLLFLTVFGPNFFLLNHMKSSLYPSGDCVTKIVGIFTGGVRKLEGNTGIVTRSVCSVPFTFRITLVLSCL